MLLKTIELKCSYIEGSYQITMNEIPFLRKRDLATQSNSYASAVKRKTDAINYIQPRILRERKPTTPIVSKNLAPKEKMRN